MKTKKTSIAKKIKERAPPETPAHFSPRHQKEEEGGEEKKQGAFQARAPRSHWRAGDDENELPLDAEPHGSRPLPPPFAQVLEGLLQKMKLRISPAAELLRAEWDGLLPPEFKGRCLPGKILRGFFYAYVPDSTALFELRRELPRLEAALASKLAGMKVRHVRLMIDPEAFKRM